VISYDSRGRALAAGGHTGQARCCVRRGRRALSPPRPGQERGWRGSTRSSCCLPAQPGEFIVAIRRNYAKHVAEAAAKGIRLAPPLERPAYLLKPGSTLVGSGGAIRYPTGETRHVDHEA